MHKLWTMIIGCDGCKSRFRLDRKLIDGYRAVRIRCRTCGSPILVMVPQQPAYRETASAPPFAERRRRPRAIHNAATAQPLLEEEAIAEATPGKLVDLQRVREAYRKRMLAGAYDISGSISTEVPYPELPFAPAGTEARENEATRELAPPYAWPRIAQAMAPVPLVLESICQREESVPGCSKILEDSFLPKEGNRPGRPAGLSIFTVMLLVTAVWTAIGFLGFHLLLPVLARTLK